MFGESNDKNIFPHTLLATDRHVSKLCKVFTNNSSANAKLSKTQMFRVIKSGGFLRRLLRSLLKPGLALMKNILKPLIRRV